MKYIVAITICLILAAIVLAFNLLINSKQAKNSKVYEKPHYVVHLYEDSIRIFGDREDYIGTLRNDSSCIFKLLYNDNR